MKFLVDSRFNKLGRETIERAFRVWETYSRGLVQFDLDMEYTPDGEIPPANIFIGQTLDSAVVQHAVEQCDCIPLGVTLHATGYPTIVAIVMDQVGEHDINRFFETAVHEIGHAIGLHDDRKDVNSVMYYASRPISAHCPNKSDMQAFCEVFGCKLEDVHYCI